MKCLLNPFGTGRPCAWLASALVLTACGVGTDEAALMAEKANALMPERAPLLDTLATALAGDNQITKAVEVQRRAMARNPDDPSLRLNLAKHLLKAGEKDQARFELETLQKLGTKFGAQDEVTRLRASL